MRYKIVQLLTEAPDTLAFLKHAFRHARALFLNARFRPSKFSGHKDVHRYSFGALVRIDGGGSLLTNGM